MKNKNKNLENKYQNQRRIQARDVNLKYTRDNKNGKKKKNRKSNI